jgi:hypothetical protein
MCAANTKKSWFNEHGQFHRDNDLPAIEFINGDKYWYVNGIHHRDNGLPAAEKTYGKFWLEYGKLHRLSGLLAIEYVTGDARWYIYGSNHSYEQVVNYYKILKNFGRYCLKKIRMR